MKEFEQVSSDDHQMSVAGGRCLCLMSGEGALEECTVPIL